MFAETGGVGLRVWFWCSGHYAETGITLKTTVRPRSDLSLLDNTNNAQKAGKKPHINPIEPEFEIQERQIANKFAGVESNRAAAEASRIAAAARRAELENQMFEIQITKARMVEQASQQVQNRLQIYQHPFLLEYCLLGAKCHVMKNHAEERIMLVSPIIAPSSQYDTRWECADETTGYTNRLIYIPRHIKIRPLLLRRYLYQSTLG